MSNLLANDKVKGVFQDAKKRQEDMLTPPLMPDEETLRKSRRRQFARKRRTGRSSTILSDPDRLG